MTFEKTTYNVLPYKFEAGTPNIAGRDRAAARRSTTSTAIGLDAIAAHERELLAYGTERADSDRRACASIGTARREGRACCRS